jgi:hypothetical protein
VASRVPISLLTKDEFHSFYLLASQQVNPREKRTPMLVKGVVVESWGF